MKARGRYNMAIERKIIDCGESGTTSRTLIGIIAAGAIGEGIYTITGKKSLAKRPHNMVTDIFNKEAAKSLISGKLHYRYLSVAIPANKEGHLPVNIYVGNEAVNELMKEVKEGKYKEFGMFNGINLEIVR